MDTDKTARDRFRHRLGNLDEKFFDIIPKSLAFKPMDNVKEFINKFVLDAGTVDVQGLRNNIETLDDLEKTLEKTKSQLNSLNLILAKFDEIEQKEKDIRVNDILLCVAGRDAVKDSIEELSKDIRIKEQTLLGIDEITNRLEQEMKVLDKKILNINISIRENESSKLVESLKNSITGVEERIKKAKEEKKKLADQIGHLAIYVKRLNEIDRKFVRQSDLALLLEYTDEKEKAELFERIEDHFEYEFKEIVKCHTRQEIDLETIDYRIRELREKERILEKSNLVYPEQVTSLKSCIEKEFQNRGIKSEVYILSDLLEISDEKWRNAVEGYMNTQKFYLVVEPQFYGTALEVYDKNRNQIHSPAGIINTRKIPLEYEENHRALSYVVRSDNRYAKAYAEYLLGRVIRCEKVEELENYSIAITPECMLYQGYVVRHLNPKDYRDPYIGANAYRVQLGNVRRQLEEEAGKRKLLREEYEKYAEVLSAQKKVSLDYMKIYLGAPNILVNAERELAGLKAELVTAEKDPTLIELQMKLSEVESSFSNKKEEAKRQSEEAQRLKIQIEGEENNLKIKEADLKEKISELEKKINQYGAEYSIALDKYKSNRKNKTAQRIFENFSPQKTQFENEKNELLNGDLGLRVMQGKFNNDYSMDFTLGLTGESEYRETAEKLRRVEIVRYEEKLRNAKEDCEKIFRSDFLSKMKEYIENAKQEFRNLNKALENVYYGDDSYHFNITFDKRKESLYRMIISEYNMEGDNNLWTEMFETQYRDEIEDLFAKLMVATDDGDKVINEYTDYRSYLDYDIEIRKKNGQKQRFSDIYAEKSGSETQVPYYVAIAASFYQLYRFGNSIRIMLLDEAFDKMDDDRIQSMMDFMNGLGLQVILATPPSKIEVIGEHVDTILTAIRVGTGSIVEEYEL